MIKQSKDCDEFLKKLAKLGYEIKCSKHIAFKYKEKEKFIRAKTIGEDYSEESLKERISENTKQKTFTIKKSYCKMPNSKQIFEELEKLNEKKNTLMQEYSSSKSEMTELYQIRKNYEKYMEKEMER